MSKKTCLLTFNFTKFFPFHYVQGQERTLVEIIQKNKSPRRLKNHVLRNTLNKSSRSSCNFISLNTVFIVKSICILEHLKAFVVNLQPTLKIALSKRLMACKNLTLKKFWWELLPNRFRIRKFHENPSLRFQGLVI